MLLRLAEKPPRGESVRRVAFLHERPDPAAGAPGAVRDSVAAAVRVSRFRGRDRESVVAPGPDGPWSLIGLGRPPLPLGKVRRAVRRVAREASRHFPAQTLFVFDTDLAPAALRALFGQLALCDYTFDRYKSRRRRRPAAEGILLSPAGDTAALAAAARDANVVAQAVAWARDLGNTPANDLGPSDFAREARQMARRAGVSIRTLQRREIARERMGGLLAVSSGSVRPPVFAIGEWRPARAKATAVLVGKGITFDAGGISIKPAPAMGEMKYDMMGAATVFATLRAARDLALPVRVVALAPLTENLPSGSACRPGDIIRMRNGKTVEIDNTDAEGRLVLADVLAYAEKFRPDVLLDFATLTGAAIVALGHECAGLMTPDDALARELIESGETVGERLWRLPVWDDYLENLKSEWADMKNTAGRAAGTINAGVFLHQFVPRGVPWAHMDIASVAHFEREQSGYAPGATGFGVALTIEFLKRRFGGKAVRSRRSALGRTKRANGRVQRRDRGSAGGRAAR